MKSIDTRCDSATVETDGMKTANWCWKRGGVRRCMKKRLLPLISPQGMASMHEGMLRVVLNGMVGMRDRLSRENGADNETAAEIAAMRVGE